MINYKLYDLTYILLNFSFLHFLAYVLYFITIGGDAASWFSFSNSISSHNKFPDSQINSYSPLKPAEEKQQTNNVLTIFDRFDVLL